MIFLMIAATQLLGVLEIHLNENNEKFSMCTVKHLLFVLKGKDHL